ncbi:fatty acyl-AMP ligase [Streptomyces sp. NBC_01353]|uniref:fatty acyl-AMP ligase n=1 Tax=Streptomyces sp. NBC_01353 TaxID=2903835 RepID=UPI002E32B3A5|nr:fatty acyl-AMP ligase [Streptomyces sp. NBC_01353]
MSPAPPERSARNATAFHDLPRAVRHKAANDGDAPAFTFVDYGTDRQGIAHTLTYRELDRRATALAGELRRRCRTGDRVALLAPHGLDYLVGFLGCLYAGTIAVPLHAPEPFRSNDRITGVLRDSEPACVLTTGAGHELVAQLTAEAAPASPCPLVLIDDLPGEPRDPEDTDMNRAGSAPADIAYLQYTSGSTRAPRGVLISNANLMAAARQCAEQSQLVAEDVIVSWLPYFHDMGLITGVAMPLSVGAHAVHLTPMAFVQQPHRWLKLISDYGGSWTAAPNFALDLCVRRVTEEQKRSLRLDALHTLCNGSEQVRPESVRAFADTFASCGFALSGHAPGYGLAEATLGVTSALDGATVLGVDRAQLSEGRVRICPPDDPEAWQLVGCGTPLPEVRLMIADPLTGVERSPGQVGEICVAGPNVSRGYWKRPVDSAELFGTALTTVSGERTAPEWLRTGDLGFLHDEELFLTGRRKDLIVIDGRNHYPADIEGTVEEALAGLTPTGTAAFPVQSADGERLVVAVELRRTPAPGSLPTRRDAVRAVRRALSGHHGIEPHEVLFVRGGTIPKTSSGKVQRHACAAHYGKGVLRDLETSW